MMPYLQIFTLIFILFNISLLKDKNLKYISTIFIAYILIIFVGLRDFVGVDDYGYLEYFNETESLFEVLTTSIGYYSYPRPYEISFYYLMSFVKVFTESFYLFQLIVSFMIVSLILYSYKKLTSNYHIALLLFSSVLYLSITMHQFRNGISMAFGLLAIVYFIQGKNAKYILISSISVLFHFSGFFLFLLPFTKKLKFTIYSFIFFIMIAILFSVLGGFTLLIEYFLAIFNGVDSLFINKVAGKFHSEKYGESSIVFGLSIIKSLLIIGMYFFLQRYYIIEDKLKLLVKIYFIGVLFLIGLSEIGIFANRVFRFFVLLEPLIIVMFIQYIKSNFWKYSLPVAYFILYLLKDRHLFFEFGYKNFIGF